ncbi:MAG TPA: MJ1255/VC2487 family glycosyltransferase [Chryseolinea sp.]|nr:MJ1255/VC2487 family glycosyltransferase [Chryseolinea sp.]
MNILYGVPGEGMGHATRSKVVIDFLLKQHNVQIVSSARAYQFLVKSFPQNVHEIKGLHFAYKNAQVSKLGTFILNLKSAPTNLLHNFSKYLLIDKNFKPDVVISDFESFTNFFAKQHRIPLLSIDNMQVMDRCTLDIEIPTDEQNNYKLAKAIVNAKVPGCRQYFVSSFFNADIRKTNTTIVPPIVRDAIQQAKPTRGNHILVYQTSSSLSGMKQILHGITDINFYVYGFNKDERDGNVTFKTFSEQGFVDDLASAAAVMANGGFSFISEAVYMKKPILSFPLKNQFEQFMNAAYIQKLGYGRHFDDLSADAIKAFLYDLEFFTDKLSKYDQDGNKVLFDVLEVELKKYT